MNSPSIWRMARHIVWLALAVPAWGLAAPATVRPAVTEAPQAASKAATAVAPLLRVKPADSLLAFTAKQIGVPMDGRFRRYDAQIRLDPKRPETGQVQISIDLGSVAMGGEEDDMLKSADWFHIAKFPKATFVSQQIKSVGPGRLQVSGVFTLKGVARSLVVPVTLAPTAGEWVATGRFSLPRLAYQVGSGEWADINVIADEVVVQFSLRLQGTPAVK